MSMDNSKEKMDLATKRIIVAMFMAMIVDGIALLGISYLMCGLIPPIVIREKIFDPKSVEEPTLQQAGAGMEVGRSVDLSTTR